jgi:hypothetical protein
MADPYPEYDTSNYETVPPTIQTVVTSAPVAKSMGAVEIGVIAVAVAITVLAVSAGISMSRRR